MAFAVLVSALVSPGMVSGDPSAKGPSLTGLEKCDRHLSKYPQASEITQDQFKRAQLNSDPRVLPGRFFQVSKGTSQRLLWLLPFAGGEACVVRQVVQLKPGTPLAVEASDISRDILDSDQN